MKNNNKVIILILILIFFIVFISSFALGRYFVSPSDVIKIILSHFIHMEKTWSNQSETVVMNIRLPRILAGVLVGTSLSTAGCVYQALFRNPMVSPQVLGASNGAGFGAALGIFFSIGYMNTTVLSFVMGLISVLLSYTISENSQGDKNFSMILSGMMIGSLFSALISFLKLIADTDNTLPAITYWLMGSLASTKLQDLYFISIPITVSTAVLYAIRWRINILTMNEEESMSLGINVKLLKAVVIVCATLSTSASVSISGIIGFVGLVVPHIARMIVGCDMKYLFSASAILGASFLLIVDNFARNIATSEVPLGILTVFVGAPLFVYLILTNNK